jgi:hypothetical protein
MGSETDLAAVSARHPSVDQLVPASRPPTLGRVFAYIIDPPFLVVVSRRLVSLVPLTPGSALDPTQTLSLAPVSAIKNSDL